MITEPWGARVETHGQLGSPGLPEGPVDEGPEDAQARGISHAATRRDPTPDQEVVLKAMRDAIRD